MEEVQAALEELAREKERLLRRNSDLLLELQARTCHKSVACSHAACAHTGLEKLWPLLLCV